MISLKNFLLNSKWLILAVIALLFISYTYHNKIFSIHFVDEEDNFILGKYLLEGQKLYSDLFSHHQPMGYILSAGYQSVTNPDNIYMLIKRHREFMIAWSFLWCALLLWKFRNKVILPLITFEITKFYLLGNLFLSESLAVYPVLYLTLLLLDKEIKPKKYEYLFSGFLIGLSALLLAPIWPFLAGYIILMFWLKKMKLKDSLFLVGGGLIPVISSLPFIDIYYYFHNVFYINFKYYIPQSGEEKLPMAMVKSSLSPLTSLINNGGLGSSGFAQKIIALFFIASLGFLIKIKNYRLLITAVVLLTLSNIRYFPPGLEYYAGFHILVWYALFITISLYFYQDLIGAVKTKYFRIILICLLFIGISAIIYSSKDLFKKNDIAHDYYVNYSEQLAYGEAIKGMKNEGDTLFVVPDQWLLYYQADIKNNNKMVNFYGWMSLVWELNGYVTESFKTNPPTFFYCDCDEKYVYNYGGDNYHQMIRDGAKTRLWVRNDRFNNLTDSQKDSIRFFNFQAE